MASPYVTSALARSNTLTRPCPTAVLRQTCTAGTRRHARQFTTSPRASFHQSSQRQQQQQKDGFGSRLRAALKDTKVQWYPIPVGLGIGFLGLVQFYKTQAREKERLEREASTSEPGARPKKRPRIRPDGPWYALFLIELEISILTILNRQASAGHVNLTTQSHIEAVGKIQ